MKMYRTISLGANRLANGSGIADQAREEGGLRIVNDSTCARSNLLLRDGQPTFSGNILPAAVHPIPLLGVAQHEPLQYRIVGAGVAADRLGRIVALDGGDRLLE